MKLDITISGKLYAENYVSICSVSFVITSAGRSQISDKIVYKCLRLAIRCKRFVSVVRLFIIERALII